MKYIIQSNKKTRISGWTKVLLCVVTVIVAVTAFFAIRAQAEAGARAWVICQPNDFVNARVDASRSSRSIGMLETGHPVEVTGKTKRGFALCEGVGLEEDQAWIHAGYLVFDEPRWSGETAEVVSNGRLAARKYADGPVRCWLHSGDQVQVFWFTDEWCVTSRGFIKTEYLEVRGK